MLSDEGLTGYFPSILTCYAAILVTQCSTRSQEDFIAVLFYDDGEAILQEPEEGVRVIGSEISADANTRDSWVIDDDLASVVTVEFVHRIRQRGISERDISVAQAEKHFAFGGRLLVDEDIGVGSSRDGAGAKHGDRRICPSTGHAADLAPNVRRSAR